MSTIWQVLVEDFSDLGDLANATRITVRRLVAAILGGILGHERESKGKTAGMRTYVLVALGAALFILIPHQAGVPPNEITRVLQGLVAGIGFLGGGAILTYREQGEVRGLTTAAGLWLTAAIGVAAGMGQEVLAILSTALAWLILTTLPHVARPSEKSHPEAAKEQHERKSL